MCRAHQSLRRRPTQVSSEFQKALQDSVLVTLRRREAARLAGAEDVSDDQAAEAVIAGLLCTDRPALGPGNPLITDPLLSQLRRTAHPLFVKRREE